LHAEEDPFVLEETARLPAGLTPEGIGPEFSRAPPISFSGTTKLAPEAAPLEYGEALTFDLYHAPRRPGRGRAVRDAGRRLRWDRLAGRTYSTRGTRLAYFVAARCDV